MREVSKELGKEQLTDVKAPKIDRVDERLNIVEKDIHKEGQFTSETVGKFIKAFDELKDAQKSSKQQDRFNELVSKTISLVLHRERSKDKDKEEGRLYCAYAVNVINEAKEISKRYNIGFSEFQINRIEHLCSIGIGQESDRYLWGVRNYNTLRNQLLHLGREFGLTLKKAQKKS